MSKSHVTEEGLRAWQLALRSNRNRTSFFQAGTKSRLKQKQNLSLQKRERKRKRELRQDDGINTKLAASTPPSSSSSTSSPSQSKKTAKKSKAELMVIEDGDDIPDEHEPLFGHVVWAQFGGFQSYHPALVIKGSMVNLATADDTQAFVFWFSDKKVSAVPRERLLEFVPFFKDRGSLVPGKQGQQGVLRAIEELQRRAALGGHGLLDMDPLHWAQSGFPTGDGGGHQVFIPGPDFQFPINILERLAAIGADIREKASLKDRDIPNEFHEESALRAVWQGTKNISDVCIGCADCDRKVTCQHPLFEGGLCSKCKELLQETFYATGEDGTYSYCAVCSAGGQLFVCDNPNCGRVYCVPCVEELGGENVLRKVKDTKRWSCFLCQPFKSCSHGLLKPHADWQKNLVLFFDMGHRNTLVPDLDYFKLHRPIRVLSLFDGIGTGLLALQRAGLVVEVYYASEIDEQAAIISQANHGQRITQLGDVVSITEDRLSEITPIDLLIGGSPCNELSLANPQRKGFDVEGSGVLFFDFYRILRDLVMLNGTTHLFWMFENVTSMRTSYRSVISRFLQCQPAVWDAKYLSAQKRSRFFWGNIPGMYSTPEVSDALRQEADLNSILTQQCGRQATVHHVRTITTMSNSLLQGPERNTLPVSMAGAYDTLWLSELERLFGFPAHYTDVSNLAPAKRRALLGRSWSVQVVTEILRPLTQYFATIGKKEKPCVESTAVISNHDRSAADSTIMTMDDVVSAPASTNDSHQNQNSGTDKIAKEASFAVDGHGEEAKLCTTTCCEDNAEINLCASRDTSKTVVNRINTDVSITNRRNIDASAAGRKDNDVSVVNKKDSKISTASRKDIDVSVVNKKDSKISTASRKDTDVSVVNKKDSKISTASRKDIDVSVVNKKDSKISTASRKDTDVSVVNKKDSKISTASRKDIDVSVVNKKDSKISTASRKDIDVSVVNKKDSKISTASRKDIDVSVVNKKDSKISTASRKDIDVSVVNKKDSKISTASRKDTDVSFANRKNTDVSVANRKVIDVFVANRKDSNVSVTNRKDVNISITNRKDTDKLVANREDADVSVTNRKDTDVCVTNKKDTDVSVANRKYTEVSVASEKETGIFITNRKDTVSVADRNNINMHFADRKGDGVSVPNRKYIVPIASRKGLGDSHQIHDQDKLEEPSHNQVLSPYQNKQDQCTLTQVPEIQQLQNAKDIHKNTVDTDHQVHEGHHVGIYPDQVSADIQTWGDCGHTNDSVDAENVIIFSEDACAADHFFACNDNIVIFMDEVVPVSDDRHTVVGNFTEEQVPTVHSLTHIEAVIDHDYPSTKSDPENRDTSVPDEVNHCLDVEDVCQEQHLDELNSDIFHEESDLFQQSCEQSQDIQDSVTVQCNGTSDSQAFVMKTSSTENCSSLFDETVDTQGHEHNDMKNIDRYLFCAEETKEEAELGRYASSEEKDIDYTCTSLFDQMYNPSRLASLTKNAASNASCVSQDHELNPNFLAFQDSKDCSHQPCPAETSPNDDHYSQFELKDGCLDIQDHAGHFSLSVPYSVPSKVNVQSTTGRPETVPCLSCRQVGAKCNSISPVFKGKQSNIIKKEKAMRTTVLLTEEQTEQQGGADIHMDVLSRKRETFLEPLQNTVSDICFKNNSSASERAKTETQNQQLKPQNNVHGCSITTLNLETGSCQILPSSLHNVSSAGDPAEAISSDLSDQNCLSQVTRQEIDVAEKCMTRSASRAKLKAGEQKLVTDKHCGATSKARNVSFKEKYVKSSAGVKVSHINHASRRTDHLRYQSSSRCNTAAETIPRRTNPFSCDDYPVLMTEANRSESVHMFAENSKDLSATSNAYVGAMTTTVTGKTVRNEHIVRANSLVHDKLSNSSSTDVVISDSRSMMNSQNLTTTTRVSSGADRSNAKGQTVKTAENPATQGHHENPAWFLRLRPRLKDDGKVMAYCETEVCKRTKSMQIFDSEVSSDQKCWNDNVASVLVNKKCFPTRKSCFVESHSSSHSAGSIKKDSMHASKSQQDQTASTPEHSSWCGGFHQGQHKTRSVAKLCVKTKNQAPERIRKMKRTQRQNYHENSKGDGKKRPTNVLRNQVRAQRSFKECNTRSSAEASMLQKEGIVYTSYTSCQNEPRSSCRASKKTSHLRRHRRHSARHSHSACGNSDDCVKLVTCFSKIHISHEYSRSKKEDHRKIIEEKMP